MIYDDAACPNIGDVHCSGNAEDCCKAGCLADPKCTALNLNVPLKRCIKRGCGPQHVSRPDEPAAKAHGVGWESFHISALPRPEPPAATPLAAGFAVRMSDVGWAFNTQVRVTDVFEQKDLGVYDSSWSCVAFNFVNLHVSVEECRNCS